MLDSRVMSSKPSQVIFMPQALGTLEQYRIVVPIQRLVAWVG